MTRHIQTGEYQIYPVAGHVMHEGQTIKVRPKTFELLLLLIEARGQLVSKPEILEKIWDDVSVDEQVIFQSIKELRKVFADTDAIKTVPRKGYAWTLAVEPMVSSGQAPEAASARKVRGKMATTWALTAALVLTIAFAVTFLVLNDKKSTAIAGTVIILPVTNRLTDTDHRWVRYGAMDHLIHRVPASDRYGIYQTVDVLDVLKRAGLANSQPSQTDISHIFSVTGAALVVEVTLGGTPREYQLLYTLHERGNTEKGALLADRVNEALDMLAARIARKIGSQDMIAANTYNSDFANEMIATALEAMQAEDYASAEKYLDAAVETEPQNIVAKRLLANSLIAQNNHDKTAAVLKQALGQAHALGNSREQARLNYWAGVHHLQTKNFEAAREFLTLAATEAEALKDWLYLGYIAEYTGHMQRATGDLAAAQKWYQKAIDYHQVIGCPYGHALGLLNIARVANELDDQQTTLAKTEAALRIIDKRELHSLEQEASRWKATLEARLLKE